MILFHFLKRQLRLNNMFELDEAVVTYYLEKWTKEDDAILSDLASRFINRDLFKYIPFDGSIITISELQELFEAGGINPDYYFVSEAFSDLPYDYDRPGSNCKPIHLLRQDGTIREISNQSLVIHSITGINRQDYKLYYPREMVAKIKDKTIREAIENLINELN